ELGNADFSTPSVGDVVAVAGTQPAVKGTLVVSTAGPAAYAVGAPSSGLTAPAGLTGSGHATAGLTGSGRTAGLTGSGHGTAGLTGSGHGTAGLTGSGHGTAGLTGSGLRTAGLTGSGKK